MTESPDAREIANGINKRIAEFMGWSLLEWRDKGTDGRNYWPGGWYGWCGTGPDRECYLASDYARSMDDLAPVIEKLQSMGAYLEAAIVGLNHYCAYIYTKHDKLLSEGDASEMAMAACAATLSYLERIKKGD